MTNTSEFEVALQHFGNIAQTEEGLDLLKIFSLDFTENFEALKQMCEQNPFGDGTELTLRVEGVGKITNVDIKRISFPDGETKWGFLFRNFHDRHVAKELGEDLVERSVMIRLRAGDTSVYETRVVGRKCGDVYVVAEIGRLYAEGYDLISRDIYYNFDFGDEMEGVYRRGLDIYNNEVIEKDLDREEGELTFAELKFLTLGRLGIIGILGQADEGLRKMKRVGR